MQKDKDLEPEIVEQIKNLEAVSNTIFVECGNVSRGCDKKRISIDLLDQHERKECNYRMVRCERNGCDFRQ